MTYFKTLCLQRIKWSNSSISKWTHVSLPNHVSLSNIPSNVLTYLLKINLQPPCCSQQDLVWLLCLALHFVLLLILAPIERSVYHLLKKKRHVSRGACKNKLSYIGLLQFYRERKINFYQFFFSLLINIFYLSMFVISYFNVTHELIIWIDKYSNEHIIA